MASSNGPGRQTTSLSEHTHHPRHLPTPVVSRQSIMSFRGDGEVLEPLPTRTLPSLSQVISGEDASSTRGRLTPDSTPTIEACRDLSKSPRPAFDADAVMKKAMETMNEQIRANGFDPNNLPTQNRPGIHTSNYSDGNAAHDDNEDPEPDPYQERADQIGVSHHIPGIGHLGDLLTPPGWKPGDEPIPPNQARQLYKEAYDAAKKKLEDSIADFKGLKGPAFQEASDLRNEEWQNHTDLNKLILEERVKVFRAHQSRKSNHGGQERTQHIPVLNLPLSDNGAYPRNAPAINLAQTRSMHVNHPIPQSLNLSHFSNGQDKVEPSPRLLSPSFLDPVLVPGTVKAVIQAYNNKKLEIKQLQHENELRLNQCLTRYGPYLIPKHYTPQQTRTQPCQITPEPQPYPRLNSGEQSNGYHNENQRLTANRYTAHPGHNALGIYDEPTELALTPVKRRDNGAVTHATEEETRPQAGAAAGTKTTPQRKRKAPSKKPSPTVGSQLSRTYHSLPPQLSH